jgi:hypothetical protein
MERKVILITYCFLKAERHVTDVLCLPILIVLVVALILHAIICINIKFYF